MCKLYNISKAFRTFAFISLQHRKHKSKLLKFQRGKANKPDQLANYTV